MSVISGAYVPTSGLVFYYNENNPRSGTSSELISNRSATIASSTTRSFASDALLQSTAAQVAQYNSSATGTGFSGSIWVRRTGPTTGTYDNWMTIDAGGPRYRQLWLGWNYNTTDAIHCSIPYYDATDSAQWFSVDPTWANAGLTLVINQWYNFTFSYNNSTRNLSTYVNGNLALSGTRPGLGAANNSNNSPVIINGCNNVPSQNTQIKSVALYNRPLIANDVRQIFNSERQRYGT